jgi:hypothetical protein
MVEHMFDTKGTGEFAGDAVLQIRLAVADLAAEDRDHWTGSAKSARLLELLEVAERLRAEVVRLAGEWHGDRAWEIDGALSPKGWLIHRAALSAGEAGRLVKSACLVRDNEPIAGALADGDITVPHVEAVSRVMSAGRERLLPEYASTLVDHARSLDIGDFGWLMRRWATLADDELGRDTFAEKWPRRHLHLSTTLGGWVAGDFLLDPAMGQAVAAAIDHLAPPDGENAPDGPRSLSQRRADGLGDLASWFLRGDRPGGSRPNLNVVVDHDTLRGNPDLTGRCELEDGGPISRRLLELLACDCAVTRILMQGDSNVLDMGRKTRLATPAQRRAVSVRDRHCRFPGCRRRPRWCDLHHIRSWLDGGPTDVDNLVLLCRRHHTLIHNSRWSITASPDGDFEFSHPARAP